MICWTTPDGRRICIPIYYEIPWWWRWPDPEQRFRPDEITALVAIHELVNSLDESLLKERLAPVLNQVREEYQQQMPAGLELQTARKG